RVNLKLTKSIVEKIKPKSDFIIANVHWGQEYQKTSNSLQRKLARELIDLGVDAIIGHHPHVVQEMEIYKNRPIFYSLGNFVFDQYFSEATQQELGVGLVFRDKSISAYVFPLQSVKSQISQMNYANAIKFTSDWTAKSRLGDNKFNNFNLKINF
ncbi:MAG: CapA family protein, partial [bacterium]